MCFNYRKLLGKIVEKFGTQHNFATAMGMSERSLSLKLNNKVTWKDTEIAKALKLLKIPANDVYMYFFDEKVQEFEHGAVG